MATLSADEIDRIAHLAKLNVPDDQRLSLTHDLTNILALVEKMKTENTDAILPIAHPLNVTQPLRADEISEKNQRDLFQENAPEVAEGLYIVPKFIE